MSAAADKCHLCGAWVPPERQIPAHMQPMAGPPICALCEQARERQAAERKRMERIAEELGRANWRVGV